VKSQHCEVYAYVTRPNGRERYENINYKYLIINVMLHSQCYFLGGFKIKSMKKNCILTPPPPLVY
jgi:hypothetical protein